MGQLSTEFINATRTGSGTTLDNRRNETFKTMKVEKDEVIKIDPLTTESKVTEALKHMVKEWPTLRDVLQTRRVTKNQCCKNLLDYLFSPTGSHLLTRWQLLPMNIARNMMTSLQRKGKTLNVLAYQLPSNDSMLEK